MTDQPQQLEQWAMETAAQLAPMLTGEDLVRVAVGLIQARGKECLHFAGKFSVGNYLAAVIAEGNKLHIATEAAFALAFSDRHAMLEEYASQWAQKWLDENKPKVTIQ